MSEKSRKTKGQRRNEIIEGLTAQIGKALDIVRDLLAGQIRADHINLQDGDLVLVRCEPAAARTIGQALRGLAAKLKERDVHVLLLPANVDLSVIDPALMEQAGWQRKPQPPQAG